MTNKRAASPLPNITIKTTLVRKTISVSPSLAQQLTAFAEFYKAQTGATELPAENDVITGILQHYLDRNTAFQKSQTSKPAKGKKGES